MAVVAVVPIPLAAAVDAGRAVAVVAAMDRAGPVDPGNNGLPPVWVDALGGAGFPLRVWVPNGTVLMEVSAITKAAVPTELFTVPAGYQDAATMGGGGRGGGRGRGWGGGGGGGGGGGK